MPYDDSRGYFRGPRPWISPAPAPWPPERGGWKKTQAFTSDSSTMIDEFDPHEPFDAPEPYASLYDPEWEGGRT